MTITEIIRLFPAVIAPAIVAQLRKRVPQLDGLLVWPVVLLVAVALCFVGTFMAGPINLGAARSATREGLALGLAAIGLHYLSGRKQDAPAMPPAPVVSTESAAPAKTPAVEPAAAWGPAPEDDERTRVAPRATP